MAECADCGKSVLRISMIEGRCGDCYDRAVYAQKRTDEETADQSRRHEAMVRVAASKIILTTETAHNLPVAERLDIVTAECAIGMHLFKDAATLFRDVFGGRSETMQRGLREARMAVLSELRREALELGADAVVGVDLDYSEISGGGKSMLLLVASGTAVTLRPQSGRTADTVG